MGFFWGLWQETAFAMLAEVTERALALTRARHLLLVGGVACEWAGPHLGWAWSHLGGPGAFGTPILGGGSQILRGREPPQRAWFHLGGAQLHIMRGGTPIWGSATPSTPVYPGNHRLQEMLQTMCRARGAELCPIDDR